MRQMGKPACREKKMGTARAVRQAKDRLQALYYSFIEPKVVGRYLEAIYLYSIDVSRIIG